MALHDIDKGGEGRLVPKPNSVDGVMQRMAHNTMSTTYRKETSANSQRIAFKNGLILTYDEENRVSSVYGYVPAISPIPIFVVAAQGYDVFADILNTPEPTT